MAFCHLLLCGITLSVAVDIALALVIRPYWIPYYYRTEKSYVADEHKRGSPGNLVCPKQMSEYECYNELMAVWMRLMDDKRIVSSGRKRDTLEILEDTGKSLTSQPVLTLSIRRKRSGQ